MNKNIDTQKIKDVFRYFQIWGNKVDPYLRDFLNREKENPYCEQEYGGVVLDSIADLTLRGGKRQRVAFLAATFQLLNGVLNSSSEKAILETATAVEILQTQLLIHDDLIDEAPSRRKGTTIHTEYTNKAREKGYKTDPKKYGDSISILAGDLTAYLACYPIIKSSEISSEQKMRILDILLLSGIDTFYGQLLDLLRDARGTTTEYEILKLAFIKAGRSSAEAPMFLGAVLANADNENVFQKLRNYAVPASVSAQLQDDILGVFGDEEKLGKSVLSDLAQGKQTLLVLNATAHANKEQREQLDLLIGKKDITHNEAEIIKSIIIDTGALQYTIERSRAFSSQAQMAMELWNSDWNEEAKQFFASVLIAAINREY